MARSLRQDREGGGGEREANRDHFDLIVFIVVSWLLLLTALLWCGHVDVKVGFAPALSALRITRRSHYTLRVLFSSPNKSSALAVIELTASSGRQSWNHNLLRCVDWLISGQTIRRRPSIVGYTVRPTVVYWFGHLVRFVS